MGAVPLPRIPLQVGAGESRSARLGQGSPGAWLGYGAPLDLLAITAVPDSAMVAIGTGHDEVDRVLGGGFVPGSVTLLGGEPGVGKSTLAHQVASSMALSGHLVVMHSAEEPLAQVARRARRLGRLSDRLLLSEGGDVLALCASVSAMEYPPALVVVDSIQTVADPRVGAAPGSVGQVRASASILADLAKGLGIAVLLIGHVTKEGSLAGPRTLEHLVDTVLSFEGDRHHSLRFLRALKHRFAATGELGLFEIGTEGLREVEDPGQLLLGDRQEGMPGSIVLPVLQGKRVVLVEMQALVTPAAQGSPRRSAQGVDSARLAMLLAVLEQRAGISLAAHDCYVSVAGGMDAGEPAADLAIVMAVVSALYRRPLPAHLVAFGELGLGGELRQVTPLTERLDEAARLGFSEVVLPERSLEISGAAGLGVGGTGFSTGAQMALNGASRRGPLQLRGVRVLEEALASSGLGG